MYIFLSRVFNKGNLSKILIIFIIGFVSRIIVNYVYDINVFTYYIFSISVIYYTFMAFVIILVNEVVSFFNFPSISLEVFNIPSIKRGVSAILKRFIGSENKIVLDMKSIDCKYRDNINKVLNILSMNESDREDFKGDSKEKSGNKEEEESGVNKSSKEVKSEDVSIKEVRQYWYNKSKREAWNRENGGSSLESDGPNYPFNKEEYVKWLNGKDINGNKIYIYDRNIYINITKEREVELLKYWSFKLKGEGDTKSLPINTTSNELIYTRHKFVHENIKGSKERDEELLKYWRFMFKGEGEPKYLPVSVTSNELIDSRHKVLQEIIKSNENSNANVNSNNVDDNITKFK